MSSRWTTFDIDNVAKRLKVRGMETHIIPPPERKAKYGNIKSNGFDSKKEERRYHDLKLLESQKLISDLQTQVRFDLKVNETLVCYYVADFVYKDIMGMQIVEDCKGFRTRVYVIKKKLMKAIYGIEILET